jgi:hypothetical protein
VLKILGIWLVRIFGSSRDPENISVVSGPSPIFMGTVPDSYLLPKISSDHVSCDSNSGTACKIFFLLLYNDHNASFSIKAKTPSRKGCKGLSIGHPDDWLAQWQQRPHSTHQHERCEQHGGPPQHGQAQYRHRPVCIIFSIVGTPLI